MRNLLKSGLVAAALCGSFGCTLLAQDAAKDAAKEVSGELKGLPARVAATDYGAQGTAGSVTIGADFKGHSLTTFDSILTTEDFVVVEVGLFGAADARLKLSLDDFSLRINGRKMPLQSLPLDIFAGSIKDPEWEPAAPKETGGKTKLNTGDGGGGGNSNDPPPPPPKMPPELRRAMNQKVQKSMLAQGERPLPQAGLLFFQYGGAMKGIKTLELMYSGPAGKATLKLQP